MSDLARDVVAADVEYMLAKAEKSVERLRNGSMLITGAAGFLGYYLMHFIKGANERGANIRVCAMDNFLRGEPAWLAEFQTLADFQIIKHDISQPLPASLGQFDWVIHAASVASPMYYRKYPIETMDANVIGLRQLLDYGVEHRVKGLLFFSSSEIYGDPSADQIPTKETYNGNVSCTGPRACYDESKRFGESLCVNFAKYRHLPVTSVRPFNNYGPGLDIRDKRVIPDFCNDILNGRDITLLSDGSPMRTFCYIADTIPGYLLALTHGTAGEAYNIGADFDEMSIREMAETLIEVARSELGYTGKLTFGRSDDAHYLTDNPNRRCPNIDKARAALGFSPSIKLSEGLIRTLNWYRGVEGAQ